MNWFYYNGLNSYEDLGAAVLSKTPYNAPAPDITLQAIPGRSGDLIIDNGRYKNVNVGYTCAIVTPGEFSRAAQKIRAALLSQGNGYKQLKDSYDTAYFRLATISSETKIEQQGKNDGKLTVTFNCQPWRYSQVGQQINTYTAGFTVKNPEAFSSLPYFKIYGSGAVTLSVNGKNFPISSIDGYVEIDSETLNTHKGTVNKNATASSADYPIFQTGNNAVSWSGSVTAIHVKPRWRTL